MNIKRVNCSKYLRIYVDDQLDWKYHIEYVYETLLKFVGIFYKTATSCVLMYYKNSVVLLYSSSHSVWCGDLCKY